VRRRFLALLLGLLGSVLAVELVARGLYAVPAIPPPEYRGSPTGMFVNDPITGFSFAPGYVFAEERLRTNALGMRDRERTPGPGAPGVRRVVVIGDSYTAGIGTADGETYAHLLEDGLAATGGPGAPVVEVWNLGVPHFGVEQSFLRLQARWDGIRPDAVVMSFFEGNDPLDDTEGPGFHHVRKGEVCKRGWAPWGGSPYNDLRAILNRPLFLPEWPDWPLLRHSYGWRLLLRQMDNLASARTDRWPYGMQPFDYEAWGSVPWLYYRPMPPKMAGGWRISHDALRRLDVLCEERGVPLLLVAIPGAASVQPARLRRAWAEGWEIGPAPAVTLDMEQPTAILAATAQELGLPFLDLQPALEAAERAERTYFEDDSHWNVAGHRVAAGALGARLVELGLAPGVDVAALDAELRRRVPVGSAPTRFSGGFRSEIRWGEAEER
jgi:lysophospholipase L1-like esterase